MEKMIEDFKEKVRLGSGYHKLVSRDNILKLEEYFAECTSHEKYYESDNDVLSIALEFYYKYFKDYYYVILSGLYNGDIIISPNEKGSYTIPDKGKSFIKLKGQERDLFVMIHEFAHFVDVKSNPHLIEYHKWGYSEVVPYYVEKVFAKEMSEKYARVINARRVNRNTTINHMLEVIILMLKYEDYFKMHGEVDSIIDIEEVKRIMNEDSKNVVNTLLKYPLANLYSAYMILNGISLEKRLNVFLDSLDFSAILEDKKVKELVLHEM